MTGHGIKIGTHPDHTDEDPRYRWECQCGQVGAISWDTPEPALRGGDRHLIEVERVAA